MLDDSSGLEPPVPSGKWLGRSLSVQQLDSKLGGAPETFRRNMVCRSGMWVDLLVLQDKKTRPWLTMADTVLSGRVCLGRFEREAFYRMKIA